MAVAVTSERAAADDGPAAIPAGAALRLGYTEILGGVPLARPGVDEAGAPAIRIGTAVPYSVEAPLSRKGYEEVDMMTTSAVVGGVFGSVAIPMKNFPISSRWRPIYQRINACMARGSCVDPKMEAILHDADTKGFFRKLALVNIRVNALVKYSRDRANYGALDHWATPDEILSLRSGDCEDYAILKMAALARVGVPLQSMSLVILRDSHRQVFHAVLSVSTSNGNYILDNLSNEVRKDTALTSYVPLYSLSTERAWIHGSRSGSGQLARIDGEFRSVAPGEGPETADRPSTGGSASSADFKLRAAINSL